MMTYLDKQSCIECEVGKAVIAYLYRLPYSMQLSEGPTCIVKFAWEPNAVVVMSSSWRPVIAGQS